MPLRAWLDFFKSFFVAANLKSTAAVQVDCASVTTTVKS